MCPVMNAFFPSCIQLGLLERCVAYCAANVSLTNSLGWLVAADIHAIAGLRATLLAYVANDVDEIEAASPGALATPC